MTPVSILLKRGPDKKHSVVYVPADESAKNPPVTGIYIMQTALGQNPPPVIKLTLEPLTDATS